MTRLILVRHSVPEIDPTVPAKEWHLSKEGQRRCLLLAEQLAQYRPQAIVASTEPKAGETASQIAGYLGLSWDTSPDLHEHDRTDEVYVNQEQFEASVAAFFAKPQELVFGRETAGQAKSRYVSAVDRVIRSSPSQTVVIVSHGTVMSLYVAACTGLDPFQIWKELDLPAYIVMSRPGLNLLEVTGRIH